MSDTEAELQVPLQESSDEARSQTITLDPPHLSPNPNSSVLPPAQPPQLSRLQGLAHPPGTGSGSVMVLRAPRLGRAGAQRTEVLHPPAQQPPHSPGLSRGRRGAGGRLRPGLSTQHSHTLPS